MKEPVAVTGVHLYRLGDKVHVSVEVDGKWRACITEQLDSNFSHIIEPGGIKDAPVDTKLKAGA